MNQPDIRKMFASLERDLYSRRDCNYKIRYEDLRQAIAAADSYMDRIAITRGPMVPYFCPKHSCWHKGHDNRMTGSIASQYSNMCVTRERLRQEIRALEDLMETNAHSEPTSTAALRRPVVAIQ